ncbi:hypothetical protein LCGC14_2121720 [marine sediment metagenome]|uniref:Pterin-binding domain-containing protein n=1 Tax=marine sediment metagenome TaxID=412755 RepID=A0A0F9GH84_9ZZZZ
MYVIGERINGMFQDVKGALIDRDAKVIQDLATAQMAAGATALDVNVGPALSDAEGGLMWLVETIREVSDAPLVIDTAKWNVMSAVVPKVPGEKILNSCKADVEIAAKVRGGIVDDGGDPAGVGDAGSGAFQDVRPGTDNARSEYANI